MTRGVKFTRATYRAAIRRAQVREDELRALWLQADAALEVAAWRAWWRARNHRCVLQTRAYRELGAVPRV